MKRLLKSQDYLMKGLGIVLLIGFISLGAIGGCNNNGRNNGGGPGEPQFDLELAIELMELSLVAYEQRFQCIKGGKDAITVPSPYKLEEVIFQAVTPILNSSCKDDLGVIPLAFIATKDDSIYVSFRGSADLSDVITDIKAIQEPYNFVSTTGKVSVGFQRAYTGNDTTPIESTILSKLDELTLTGNFKNLYITGHSLGAALALLAFPDFSQNVSNIDNVVMYNFAGPAAGDSNWVSTYEGEYAPNRISFRIVNKYDLVPMLPPLGLDCTDFSYFHVDNKHEITFGTELPSLPPFAKDECKLLKIGAQLAAYLLKNKEDAGKNHYHCNYFSSLCSMGSSPETCSQRAIGCGCCVIAENDCLDGKTEKQCDGLGGINWVPQTACSGVPECNVMPPPVMNNIPTISQ
ncbi:MAG: lipase family protein [Candidatus Dadabacteria bacterium]